MNVKQNVSEALKQEFHITVGSEEIALAVTNVLAKKLQTVKMPGFRPGKVPMNVVRQHYEGSAIEETLNSYIQTASRNVIKDNNLKPAVQPTFTLDPYTPGKDFSFKLHVEVLPEVTLPDYAKISIEKLTAPVDASEIEEFIGEQAKQNEFPQKAAEDATPKENDRVVISLDTRVGKNIIKVFTVKDAVVRIGSSNFLFDFIEDELKTKKAGEEFTVEKSFDANYPHKALAGKKATFNVNVVSIEHMVHLPVGEDLAKACGVDTLADLKERMREQLQKRQDANIHLFHKRKLLDVLADHYTFELPASLVKSEFDAIWSRLKQEMEEARQQGMLDAEDDKSDEELTKEYQAIAERRVRLGLVIAEIARHENIRLDDRAIQGAIIQDALKYQGQERQVIDYYRRTPTAVDMLVAPILEDRVLGFILDKVKATDVQLTTKELHARFSGILPGFDEDESADNAEKPKAEKKVKSEKEDKPKKEKSEVASEEKSEKPKKAKKEKSE